MGKTNDVIYLVKDKGNGTDYFGNAYPF
jgi:hypothetical protein